MLISREIKISDDNYGNTTRSLSFEIMPENLAEVEQLFDEYEGILRNGAQLGMFDMDSLTVKAAKELEEQRVRLTEILQKIAAYSTN